MIPDEAGLTSVIPKSLSKYEKKRASLAASDTATSSASTADNAMHFCTCDFQLNGHPYTYVTAPDVLLRPFCHDSVMTPCIIILDLTLTRHFTAKES
ncbi:uncharacterized protein UDID_17270 [Ustilago sp. UG-2017a]|nr:uncharacterized protein UDID_17270 [Ustilago sp. UG-2017a]